MSSSGGILKRISEMFHESKARPESSVSHTYIPKPNEDMLFDLPNLKENLKTDTQLDTKSHICYYPHGTFIKKVEVEKLKEPYLYVDDFLALKNRISIEHVEEITKAITASEPESHSQSLTQLQPKDTLLKPTVTKNENAIKKRTKRLTEATIKKMINFDNQFVKSNMKTSLSTRIRMY
ncbi:uncharacterized protein NDAI_0E01680 [Naumovozyma dairenensis CBS 421]|uniref:Uncharacterized protein n=1 Tax=Naumovozyma dairenensis (strain ATCC 10597 / BCRC 20456 / CBS 421 / NBRC 0211 / NRRL Y-12639) TaxID=1071378 RepID=G0WB64_NAUDC|nr:hypothetical protein NDAI_0E01680 [Naumovozyma dairenensis CBS 421]CCD24984.1 hypothetical protein NDAI_0E01680 [Naumovozyma dairenensis CBS 421]